MRVVNKKYLYFDKVDHNNFKLFLVDNNMSKQKFAKKIGVSVPLLSAILNGKRALTEENKKKFEKEGFKFDD